MKKIIVLAVAAFITVSGFAQKADLGNSSTPITFLGLDFSQLKFIGDAAQWKDAGSVTSETMKSKYFPAWNEIFIKEKPKYDVAGAVDRSSVEYALDVTESANDKISNGDFFSKSSSDYKHISADNISSLVGKYDFKGKKGVGLMFFVESMDKDGKQASIWVTFVNMDSKKVIFTKRYDETAGGFGFSHYWAKTFFNALGDIKDDHKSWSKS